jgi:hypothetical protein
MNNQNFAVVPSKNKKTWSSPTIQAIDLNSARFGTLGGNDASNGTKTRS